MDDEVSVEQKRKDAERKLDRLLEMWERQADRREKRCQEPNQDGSAGIEGQTTFSDDSMVCTRPRSERSLDDKYTLAYTRDRHEGQTTKSTKRGRVPWQRKGRGPIPRKGRLKALAALLGWLHLLYLVLISAHVSAFITKTYSSAELNHGHSLEPSPRNRRASSEPLATQPPLDQKRRHSLSSLPMIAKTCHVHGEIILTNGHNLRIWFQDLIKKIYCVANFVARKVARLSSILLYGIIKPICLRFFQPLQIVFDWIIAITSLVVIIGLIATWGISQLSPLTSLVVSSLVTSSGLCRIPYARKLDLFEVCPVAQPVAIFANHTPRSEQLIHDLDEVFDGWKDVIDTANSHLALPHGLRKSKADYAVLARQLRYSTIPLPGGDELIYALRHLSESIGHQADSLIGFNFALLSTFHTLAAVTEHTKRQLSIAKDGHDANLASTGFWLFSRSTLEADMVILRREYLAHCTIVLTHLGALLDAADKVLSLLKQGHIDLSVVNQKVFWINQQLGADSSSSAKSVSASSYRLWWSRVWLWNDSPRQLQDSRVLNVSDAVRLSEQAYGYLELVRAFVFDRRKAWESFEEHLRTISCVEGGDMALEVHLNILSSQMQWYTIIADEARSRTLEHATVHVKDSRKPDNAD